MLDFSRIEQGRKQYEFEPTDLVALAQTTVKLMKPYATEKGVMLKWETFNIQHSTPNIELNVDGRAIQQALVNLIDNAVKHSPKGETVTVDIESRKQKAEIPTAILFVYRSPTTAPAFRARSSKGFLSGFTGSVRNCAVRRKVLESG